MGILVAGLDEAGRGAWAGPIFAGACILSSSFSIEILKDSKKLSPKTRIKAFEEIRKSCDFGIGISSVKEIEDFGIIKSTNLAMKRAIVNLKIKPDKLLVDGRDKFKFDIDFISIIKGDEKIPVISAASIIAKVSRDKYMESVEKNIKYQFSKHKGYGTKLHSEMLKKYGSSIHHRKNFTPIRNLNQKTLNLP